MISTMRISKVARYGIVALGIFLFLMLLPMRVGAVPVSAQWDSLCVYGDEEVEDTKIMPQEIGGKTYLVLPSTVSPKSVKFQLDVSEAAAVQVKGTKGEAYLEADTAVDLTELADAGGTYDLTIVVTDGATVSDKNITVIFSENVGAMYLHSEDPVNKGREWVEASPTKDNKAKGNMVFQQADGTIVYDGLLTQIKGRGNSTWSGIKKPYQIKLDKKTDLLQTGDDENKSKTWVLLANLNDWTLLRNTVALDLGNAMNMESGIESTHIDLYYDGEYRGSYLLSEKVEVGSGRVDIRDLEEANEAANPDKELDEFSIKTGKTANGASYTYCEGLKSAEDITGGYLLEMEASYRAVEEACYFWTKNNEYVVVKSPEYCSKAQMDYIASLYQEYENALYGDGFEPITGKHYTEYVDLKSTAQCYLINELTKNLDGFRTSAFLYKEAGKDMMTMGPLWDYDLGFGHGAGVPEVADLQRDPEGLYTVRSIFGSMLYKHGDFREEVKAQWQNNLYPLLSDVVLGAEDAVSADGSLRSFDYYMNKLSASAGCDYAMWRGGYDTGAWIGQVASFKDYLTKRTASLNDIFAQWNADECGYVSAFLDVPDDAWYGEPVTKAKQYGLMNGVSASIEHYPLFEPDGASTRAAVARVIYNMEAPEQADYTNPFSDVEAGSWYADAVCWGVAHSIINGYPDGTYRPDNEITREDMVTLLYRYCGVKSENTDALNSFADRASVSDYAQEAMNWAISEGVITGYPDKTVRPRATISRAELATLLVRYYERFVLGIESGKDPEELPVRSDKIHTMYIVSDDPEAKGREWVESSKDKSNKATGTMILTDPEGNEIYNGVLTQIKGRGNSTWGGAKKPYQIKLDKKTDLLQTGEDDNKTKTWVLLANYYDPALIRNTISLNMSRVLGMETFIESTYVDLYYDGEYRGCYLLAEKVEVGDGRVAITDMEGLNEEVNPDIEDFDDLEVKEAVTENGAMYTYCDGMKSPENITGGYLLEMDFTERAVAEICYFKTSRDNYVVVKSPEYASKDEMEYIASFYQEYEDAVYAGGVNPDTGKSFKEYTDLESIITWCVLNEFVKNVDAFKSSTYLYKDADSERMVMGPMWDYDLSLGMDSATCTFSVSPEGLNSSMGVMGTELYKLTEVRKGLKSAYLDKLYPLIEDVVLGEKDAVSEDGHLRSIAYYEELLSESAIRDDDLWKSDYLWTDAVADLKTYVRERADYLKDFFEKWPDAHDAKTGFLDVTQNDWYYEDVTAAVEKGLMNGISSAYFEPQVQTQRCQAVHVLYKLSGANDVAYKQLFTDVKETDWYAKSITWAVENRIANGREDHTFGPFDVVSKEDLMVMLYRYHGGSETELADLNAFADKEQIADYAAEAVGWAVQAGILTGNEENLLEPKKAVTRAELAVFLVRYCEMIE